MSFHVSHIPGFDSALKIELYEGDSRAGYISIMKMNIIEVPGYCDVSAIDRNVATIVNAYVEPEHRSKGYGKLLTVKAIEVAKSTGYRFLTVGSRFEGDKFFESLGFEPCIFNGCRANVRILSLPRWNSENRQNDSPLFHDFLSKDGR